MAKGNKAAKSAPADIVVGSFVSFLGYAVDVPDEQRILTKDAVYPVTDLTDNGFIVRFPNPEFDSTLPENDDANPANVESEVFREEVALTAAPAEAAQVAPAPVATKIKAGKAPASAVVPLKKAKLGKQVKEPKVAVSKEEEEEAAAANDDLPVLTVEQEDADVLAIVNESKDLVATAQGLEGDIGRSEYRMGGVLYHIKRSKSFEELNPVYKENAGFAAFLKDYLNIDYRKAMHLIEIYVTFSMLGIDDPASKVAAIGWTKASKIVKPMNDAANDPQELLTLAQENTVADLVIAIREQTVHVGGVKGEAKKRISMKFRFFEEEGISLVEILRAAREQQGLKNDDEALSYILADWAATNGGGLADVEKAPKQTAPVGTAKATTKPTAKIKAAA